MGLYHCVGKAEGWILHEDTCYSVLDRKAKWYDVQKICHEYGAEFAYLDDTDDMVTTRQKSAEAKRGINFLC